MEAPPVQYVTTSDGFSIAYGVRGDGPPLVLLPFAFNHIQVGWSENSWFGRWLDGLASRFRFVRYDGRGQGMSTRNLPATFKFADLEHDLEAVIERLELDKVVLMAVGPIGHIAVGYAARHPERVQAIFWHLPNIRGDEIPDREIVWAEQDWRGYLLSVAGRTQAKNVELHVQRLEQSSTPLDWIALVHAAMQSDISDVLPDLDTPLLLTHPRDFGVEIEMAQRVAIATRNARLVVVDGNFLPEPEQGLTTLQDFLASISPPSVDLSRHSSATPVEGLSVREVEVLRLLARGKSNAQIADELVISPNTVNRHVSNIYAKTGAANRAEAASYATRNGLA
jgi:DNA-binding CsgD family transcriptional regulator/pimeloyl-ACP methyl ester carboxylesterase